MAPLELKPSLHKFRNEGEAQFCYRLCLLNLQLSSAWCNVFYRAQSVCPGAECKLVWSFLVQLGIKPKSPSPGWALSSLAVPVFQRKENHSLFFWWKNMVEFLQAGHRRCMGQPVWWFDTPWIDCFSSPSLNLNLSMEEPISLTWAFKIHCKILAPKFHVVWVVFIYLFIYLLI